LGLGKGNFSDKMAMKAGMGGFFLPFLREFTERILIFKLFWQYWLEFQDVYLFLRQSERTGILYEACFA